MQEKLTQITTAQFVLQSHLLRTGPSQKEIRNEHMHWTMFAANSTHSDPVVTTMLMAERLNMCFIVRHEFRQLPSSTPAIPDSGDKKLWLRRHCWLFNAQ